MPVEPGLVGREFPPTAPYLVSASKIAEFNAAIGAEPVDDGQTAPLTFPIVVAFDAMLGFMHDPGVGVNLHNIVHGDQSFEPTRSIRVGDELTAVLTVTNVRSSRGMDMIKTRTVVSTTAGEPVCTAEALLVHREEEAG